VYGAEVDKQLIRLNAYNYWRNILKIDPDMTYALNEDVLKRIVHEQALITADRLKGVDPKMIGLIKRTGIFSESGWKLKKYKGSVFAVRADQETNRELDKREVFFRSVDTEYAKYLQEKFHYIHTPRAVKSYGLFLEGEELPFSVVAFDEVDREYKKDLLLMLGYNPEKCLDLSRLYSRPGTPFNTSSTIFSLAFAHLRENEPSTQAVLSAFMPTYSHGMSMISAGFNFGVLVKEWRHSFAKRNINGKDAWELVTKRRVDNEQTIMESQWPLLPVFELLATLRPPRFTPFDDLTHRWCQKIYRKLEDTSSSGSYPTTHVRRSLL
jgi:hypothetical protein